MKLRSAIFILFSCFLFNFSAGAQENAAAAKSELKFTKTGYYYSFSGAHSREEVETLQQEIYALLNLTEFKGEFKAEKELAQIIVIVYEKTMTSEGEKFFEPADLKKILERHNY